MINTVKSPSWSWSVIEGELHANTDIYINMLVDRQDLRKAELTEISLKNIKYNPFGQEESAALRLHDLCQAVNKLQEPAGEDHQYLDRR